jgi:hypothetical protein
MWSSRPAPQSTRRGAMTKAEAELLELMRASDRARICGLSPRSRWKRVPTRVPGHARDFVREAYPEEAKEICLIICEVTYSNFSVFRYHLSSLPNRPAIYDHGRPSGYIADRSTRSLEGSAYYDATHGSPAQGSLAQLRVMRTHHSLNRSHRRSSRSQMFIAMARTNLLMVMAAGSARVLLWASMSRPLGRRRALALGHPALDEAPDRLRTAARRVRLLSDPGVEGGHCRRM